MPVLKYVDGTWTTHGGPEGQRGLPGLQGAQGPVNPLNVGRNRLVNGDFSVNQRQFTTSGVGATIWGADRWKSIGYGSPMTLTLQTAVTGELPESALQYLRLITSGQTNAASHYMRVWQSIEAVRTLSGKTVTVSFWARAATGTPKIGVDWYRNYGGSSGGSVGTYTPIGQVTISTVWTRYSLTFDAPSLEGKVMGTGPEERIELNFFVSAGTDFDYRFGPIGMQNNTFDFWGIQMEEGPVATLFETKTYDEQLRACQRYFMRLHQPSLKGQAGAAEYCTRMAMPLPVDMYKVPTVAVGGTLYVWDGIAGSTYTSISENYSTTQTLEVQMHTATSFTAVGRSIVGYQSGVLGYLDLTAEM